MPEEFEYPMSDEESEYDNSISQVFHDQPYDQTDLSELNFEFSATDTTFRPVYYPERVAVGKKRDLVREKGICKNEYVNDVGAKNREIHAVGYVMPYQDPELRNEYPDNGSFDPNANYYQNNLQSFHDMCDFGQRGDLITMQWSGEVLLADSDLEGPIGIDADTGHYMYEYTLDFVSTGRDEMGVSTTGVLNEGE